MTNSKDDIVCIENRNTEDVARSDSACNFSGEENCPLLCKDILLPYRLIDREDRCHKIQNALEKDPRQMTLVTGAGISISAGIPGWNKFVNQMLGEAFYANIGIAKIEDKPEDRKLLSEMFQMMSRGEICAFHNINPLESAEYISAIVRMENEIYDSRTMEPRLMQALIRPIIEKAINPEKFLTNIQPPHHCVNKYKYLAEETRSTLAAVAYLISQENGFHRALTYNYHTLLQEYMTGVFDLPEDHLVTHVEKLTEKPGAVKEVFHLHGCIPRVWDEDSENEEKLKTYGRLSEHLILSEDSYHEVEKQGAYNWFNTIQSYYLNNSTCVFVGFSGDDYNFRRILRQFGHGNARDHYLVVTIDDLYKDIYKDTCRYFTSSKSSDEIARMAKLLLDRILESKDKYWREYRFYPIWVTIEDIPKALVSLLP